MTSTDRSSGRAKTRHLGRDRVELSGNRLTIVTPVSDLPGWEVRKYRAPRIRFDGRSWRIVARTPGPDKTMRYVLEAWDPLDGELTGPEIDYSPESVALRDHANAIGRRRSRVTGLLGLVSPVTGFLTARMKDRLETVYGIDPVASTSLSVMIQVVAALGALVLATIGQMVKVYGYDSGIPVVAALALAVVALTDAAVRWSRILAEERPAPGFYEWLFRRRR
jgi:hypothetical protein